MAISKVVETFFMSIFFQVAILTMSMARMAIKPYINREKIE
jgi:hypothetical protein